MQLDNYQTDFLKWIYLQGKLYVPHDKALQSAGVISKGTFSKYALLNSLLSVGVLDYNPNGCISLAPSTIIKRDGEFIGLNLPFEKGEFSPIHKMDEKAVISFEEIYQIKPVFYQKYAWMHCPSMRKIISDWPLYDVQNISYTELEKMTFSGWKNIEKLDPGLFRFSNNVGSLKIARLNGLWYTVPSQKVQISPLEIAFTGTQSISDLKKRFSYIKEGLRIETFMLPPLLLRLLIHSVFLDFRFENGYGSLILGNRDQGINVQRVIKKLLL